MATSMNKVSSLTEITDDTLRAAYHAGVTYWKRNKPEGVANGTVARSCGFHDANETAWLAGFYNAKLSHAADQMRLDVRTA